MHRIVTQRDAAGWRPSKDDLDRYDGAIPGEIYADFGTNAYNFVKLENPPAYEPTHCDGCGVVSFQELIGAISVLVEADLLDGNRAEGDAAEEFGIRFQPEVTLGRIHEARISGGILRIGQQVELLI